MRVLGVLLGMAGGIAGVGLAAAMIRFGQQVMTYGPAWDAGRTSEAGQQAFLITLGILLIGGGLLGLFGLLGFLGGSLAWARPRAATGMMVSAAVVTVLVAGAAAALGIHAYPGAQGLKFARLIGGPMALPGALFLLASLFSRRPRTAGSPRTPSGVPGPSLCPRCGKAVGAGAAFCTGCGLAQQGAQGPGLRCPTCHRVTHEVVRFCRGCGTRLRA